MLNVLAAAIIVGHVQVGPDTCRVDFLVPDGAGEWELITEVNSCHLTTELIKWVQ